MNDKIGCYKRQFKFKRKIEYIKIKKTDSVKMIIEIKRDKNEKIVEKRECVLDHAKKDQIERVVENRRFYTLV